MGGYAERIIRLLVCEELKKEAPGCRVRRLHDCKPQSQRSLEGRPKLRSTGRLPEADQLERGGRNHRDLEREAGGIRPPASSRYWLSSRAIARMHSLRSAASLPG